jgi:hypothetical protein
MTISALLTDLTRAGVRLARVDDRIEADAPAGALTADLLEILRTHKPDLLEIFAPPAGPCPRCGSAVLVELVTGPTVCRGCIPVAPAAVLRKLVWNDELRAAESYDDALRSVHDVATPSPPVLATIPQMRNLLPPSCRGEGPSPP